MVNFSFPQKKNPVHPQLKHLEGMMNGDDAKHNGVSVRAVEALKPQRGIQ